MTAATAKAGDIYVVVRSIFHNWCKQVDLKGYQIQDAIIQHPNSDFGVKNFSVPRQIFLSYHITETEGSAYSESVLAEVVLVSPEAAFHLIDPSWPVDTNKEATGRLCSCGSSQSHICASERSLCSFDAWAGLRKYLLMIISLKQKMPSKLTDKPARNFPLFLMRILQISKMNSANWTLSSQL